MFNYLPRLISAVDKFKILIQLVGHGSKYTGQFWGCMDVESIEYIDLRT